MMNILNDKEKLLKYVRKIVPVATVLALFAIGCEMNSEDETIPAIHSVYPADGAVTVPLDTNVVITFSEPMDTASCEERFFAYMGDVSQMSHGMMHNETEISGIFNWNDGHTVMIFYPDSVMMDSMAYTYHLMEGMESHNHGEQLMMSGMSQHGRPKDDGIVNSFTTMHSQSSDSAPAILSLFPVDGSIGIPLDTSIVIFFTEPMDTASCEDRFIAFEGDGDSMGHGMMHDRTKLPGSITWNDDHTMMTFHPDSAMMDSTMYTYHLAEGMESHGQNGQMMMSEMGSFGKATDDGIVCTFSTEEHSENSNNNNYTEGI